MNRHEQVGALLLRLGDTHLQRDKHVFVAGHIGLHIAFFVDQRPEAAGNLQHHIFLAGAILPHGAGVFAAVSGIEHNDNRPVTPGFARLRSALRRRHLTLQIAFVVILEQRQQRILNIGGVGGVEVHHQTLFKAGHRREGKQLRLDVLLELKDHAHGLRIKLAHAGGLNKGVVIADLPPHALQYRVKVNPFQIHHHPLRVTEGKLPVFQHMIRFYRDARVGRCWPDANSDHPRIGSQPHRAHAH